MRDEAEKAAGTIKAKHKKNGASQMNGTDRSKGADKKQGNLGRPKKK